MKEQAGIGAFYGLGFLGALVYFIQRADGLEGWIIGLVKAVIWPGIFVYQIFQFLRL